MNHSRDLVHAWQPDPHWQESVAVWFFDEAIDVGGYFRFGVHPNQGAGRYNLFAFREGDVRFRRLREDVPAEGKPGEPLAVGGCIADVDGTQVRFAWDEPECSANLRFDELHPPLDFAGRPADDALLQGGILTGHHECAGTVTGTVRIGDVEHHLVNALCHRDRSWGPRRVEVIHTNRMFTGTCGPELTFAFHVIQLADGSVLKVGHVVRGGVVEQFDDVLILPAIHLDGYSVAGGNCQATLQSGERLVFEAHTIAGQLSPFDGYLCSEHISRVRCGDLTGFCDHELTNNPRLGTQDPRFLMYVDGGDGLSPWPAPAWRDAGS